jgi:hypothetical protein
MPEKANPRKLEQTTAWWADTSVTPQLAMLNHLPKLPLVIEFCQEVQGFLFLLPINFQGFMKYSPLV